MKTVFNVIRVIVAVFLSFILLASLVGGNLLYSASSCIQEDTIQNIVAAIDFSEVVVDADVYTELENVGLDADAFGRLMDSEAMEEMMDLYMQDIFNMMQETDGVYGFTSENVQEIMNRHMEELMPIVNEMLQQTEQLTEEEMRQQVFDLAESIIESVPTADQIVLDESNMTEEDMEFINTLQALHTGEYILPFVVLSVVISLGILLCRYEKFEGFVWLTVLYLLSGGFSILIGSAFANNELLVSTTDDALMAVIVPLLATFGKKMMMGAFVLLACAILFVVIFVVGRKILKNKENNVMIEVM